MNRSTDLTCRELVELVTDYLDDALPAAERQAFEAHVTACDGCWAYVDQIRAAIELARRTRDLERRPEVIALHRAFRDRMRGL